MYPIIYPGVWYMRFSLINTHRQKLLTEMPSECHICGQRRYPPSKEVSKD